MTALTMAAEDFAAAVAWSVRFVPGRATHPILHGLLLDATDDGLTITSTDYETWGTCHASAHVIESGRMLIPGRLLAAVAKNIGKSDVRMLIDGTKLRVTTGRAGSWTLPILDADEYPKRPAGGHAAGTVDGAEFRGALARVLPAVDKTDIMPMWGAVRLRTEDGALEIVASDRYRIALAHVAWQSAPENLDLGPVLVHRSFVDAAAHGIGAEAAPVEIRRDGGTLTFASPRYSVTGRLIAEEWPSMRGLPQKPTRTATVLVDEFAAAVARVLAVTDGRPAEALMAQPVRLDLCTGGEADPDHAWIELSAAIDENRATAECVLSDYDGDGMTIALNPSYLHDCLRTMQSDLAEMWLGPSNEQPLTFIPLDDNGKLVENYRHIMMPVRPERVKAQ